MKIIKEDSPSDLIKCRYGYYLENYYFYVHREDGPAVEWKTGAKFWYFEDKLVPVHSQEEFEKWLRYKDF